MIEIVWGKTNHQRPLRKQIRLLSELGIPRTINSLLLDVESHCLLILSYSGIFLTELICENQK